MIRHLPFFSHFALKIVLAFLFVILFPTFFLSVAFNMKSTTVVTKNARESALQIAQQTAGSLSFIFNTGSDTSDFIFSDPNIQNSVVSINSSRPEELSRMITYMNTILNRLVSSNSFVRNVYVFKEEGNGWGSGTFSPDMYKLMRIRVSDEEWVKEAKRKNGGLVWQRLQYDRLNGDNTDLILPIGRVLKDFKNMNRIGYMQVNLNGDAILNTIKHLKLGKTGKFFVVDSEGKIMIDSDLRQTNKRVKNRDLRKQIVGSNAAEFQYTMNKAPYFGVKQPLSNGWIIVGTVPIREITGQLDRLQSFILLSSGFLTMLSVGIGLLMVGRITKPINQLTLDMYKVQKGDLTVRTVVRSTDEIGLLSQQFNSMLQEIEQLMQQVKEEQDQKLQAKLRAVMHRINPHFLLNTLSMLWWLVKSNQKERASQSLSALIHLLEAHMGKSGVMITLEEELDFLRKYIAILQMRYEKTFKLELDVEPGVEKLIIPRMLLQPLVENAIFHGIVPNEADGRISIRVHQWDGHTEFLVTDNGLGIGEEKLKLLAEPETAIAKGVMGIGLRHVYDTLRFYYAGSSELTITSEPSQGTAVRVVLGKPAASD
jgi:two-component system sensor histidine kinase YesM